MHGGVFLKIPNNILHLVFPIPTDDHMQMICHQAPSINYQSFVCLTVLDRFNNYILVNRSCKNIHPRLNCKAYEVLTILIADFVALAHASN